MIEPLEHIDVHRDSRFSIFGLILFTEAHAHVVKLLKDSDYFNAIDEISGELLPVYATCLFKGAWEEGSESRPARARLIRVWTEPERNRRLYPYFGIADGRALPALVVCASYAGQLRYRVEPIKGTSAAAAFESVKSSLLAIVKCLHAAVDPHAFPERAFAQVRRRLVLARAKQRMIDLVTTLGWFRDAAGI